MSYYFLIFTVFCLLALNLIVLKKKPIRQKIIFNGVLVVACVFLFYISFIVLWNSSEGPRMREHRDALEYGNQINDTINEQLSTEIPERSYPESNPSYNNKVQLPFNFEAYKQLCSTDTTKCRQIYPSSIGKNIPDIRDLILAKPEATNPEVIYRINNGDANFDTYIYESVGEAESQTLINVRSNKIIASLSIGYDMGGEDKSYQSFILNKDLTVNIYDISYAGGTSKLLSSYGIKHNGKIEKITGVQ